MTNLYERTREAIMRMQAAQQFEMMSQMQMLGLLGMTPTVPTEMNRMMFENQLAVVNPFLANPLWNLHAEPSHMPLQSQLLSKLNDERHAESRSRDEQPLDLSRKSGLEAIIDIETANYNHKQRKQSQQLSKPTDKETTGYQSVFRQEEIVRNGYGIKRNYSQVDLTAAVNDIRASVVYGIPRSTLRNKIYKLEAAEEQA
ncbi:Helix-turn-helix protein, partial [Trichostrongylus colubriformis]